MSLWPKYAVTNKQKGEKANIKKILNFAILSISLLKFNGNIEEKYIGIKKKQAHTSFGRELFIAANGAKILWIGK